MGDTKIEWTNATWNPVRGCSLVSAGCTNCYAMRQAHRQSSGAYKGLTRLGPNGPVWTGDVRLVPEALEYPLRLKKPHMIFVNSMSDLFHEGVGDAAILRIFSVMEKARQHTFQILTKRPERMQQVMPWIGRKFEEEGLPWPLSHVWLGVSCEDQKSFDERWPYLRDTASWTRWLSLEPLLGPIDATAALQENHYYCDISNDPDDPTPAHRCRPVADWVVIGGESGPGARPMRVEWAKSLIDQCKAEEVPVFMKQVGRWPSGDPDEFWTRGGVWQNKDETDGGPVLDSKKGGDPEEWPEYLRVREFPAKAVTA